jgi:hypothetical protein
MNMTSLAEVGDRDIDTDPTLKMAAIDQARLAAIDLPTYPEAHTRSELSSELRSALYRLTPAEQPKHRTPNRVLPVVRTPPKVALPALSARPVLELVRLPSTPPEAISPVVRRLARTAAVLTSFATALWVVFGHTARVAADYHRRASSMARSFVRSAAERFTQPRRHEAVGLYRALSARLKLPALIPARGGKRAAHPIGTRRLFRR